MGHPNAHFGFIRVTIVAWRGVKVEETEQGKAAVSLTDQEGGKEVGPVLWGK